MKDKIKVKDFITFLNEKGYKEIKSINKKNRQFLKVNHFDDIEFNNIEGLLVLFEDFNGLAINIRYDIKRKKL